MPLILNEATLAFCPHMGKIQMISTHPGIIAGGAPVMALGDPTPVIGCAFMEGPVPMPCVTVQWTAPAAQVSVQGVFVLTETSVGLCLNAMEAPQGEAMIDETQPQVQAL